MNSIQPSPYNQIPILSTLKKPSISQKVPVSISMGSLISAVIEKSFSSSVQRPKAKRKYNRITRRNLRKELEDQGVNLTGYTPNRIAYLANQEKRKKESLDRSRRNDVKEAVLRRYWENPEYFRKRKRDRYRANPESFREKQSNRYWANIEVNRGKNRDKARKFRLRESEKNDCLEKSLDMMELFANKV